MMVGRAAGTQACLSVEASLEERVAQTKMTGEGFGGSSATALCSQWARGAFTASSLEVLFVTGAVFRRGSSWRTAGVRWAGGAQPPVPVEILITCAGIN